MQRTIDLPSDVCNAIGTALRRFVDQQESMKLVARFHDHPVWYIQKEDGRVIRRVQVAPFETENGSYLRMIPNAYMAKDVRNRRSIGRAAIKEVPLFPLYGLAVTKPEQLYDALQEQLWSAWKQAESLSPVQS